jgi:predicted branched-subunit amino acid permease
MSRAFFTDFRAGTIAIAPAALGAIPFGLLLGANAALKGLSVLEVVLMSATVYAGSAQFAAVEIWRIGAVPWALLGLTALTINLRFMMMSASLSPKIGHFHPAARIATLAAINDEVWAMAERRAGETGLSPAFYLGMTVVLWLNWVVSTALGAAFGSLAGDPTRYGFDFAMAAIFIGFIAGFWRGSRTGVVIFVSAAVAFGVERWVGGVWHIVAGGLAGVAAAALLHVARQEQAA